MKFLTLLLVFLVNLIYSQNLVSNHDFEKCIIDNEYKFKKPEKWIYLNRKDEIYNKPYFDYKDYLIEYEKQYKTYLKNWIFDPKCEKFNENIAEKEEIGINDICFCKLNENNEYDRVKIDTTHAYSKPINGSYYFMSTNSKRKCLYQTKLKNKLKKDSLYYFEISYKFITYNDENNNLFMKGKLGAYFTNNDFSSSEKNKIILGNSFKYTPQILLTQPDIDSKNKWVKFHCTFRPKADFKYMIIGNHSLFNFDNKEELYPEILKYKIDNIELIPYYKKLDIKNIKKGDIISLENIEFDINSEKLKPNKNKTLNKLYNILKNSNIEIVINGHTDNIGDIQNNITLSENRAKAVAEYLIYKGISSERLQYKGYGSSKSVATNKTEEGKQQNRRVEIEILNK